MYRCRRPSWSRLNILFERTTICSLCTPYSIYVRMLACTSLYINVHIYIHTYAYIIVYVYVWIQRQLPSGSRSTCERTRLPHKCQTTVLILRNTMIIAATTVIAITRYI